MNLPGFIKNNLLFKVTSVNAVLVFVRMGFSLVTQKVLAVFVGAEGIAIVGDLKNIINFIEQFTIIGTSNGLIKYISEYKQDREKLNQLFSTAFLFAAIGAITSFTILFFFSKSLSDVIFGIGKEYGYIFKILAFIVPFVGLNAILYSLLNGLSAYKIQSKTSVIAILFGTFLTIVLTVKIGLKGSLLAITMLPLIHFISYLVFYNKGYKAYIKLRELSTNFNFKNQLLLYSFMTIIVAFFINVNNIAIRNLIENKMSASDAGYWTAMTSLSKMYMQFLAALFPLYILPRYAEITSGFEFRKEVKKIYKLLLPMVAFGMIMIYLFKETVVKLVYTHEFLDMLKLFKWQLLGDFIKFMAIVLSYQFLAKRQVGYYVFTEILSVLLFYGFSVYFIEIYDTEGIVIAHFIRYILYFLVVIFVLRHKLFSGKV